MPTLEEVARLAGVSRSTVSRVVNNHPNVRAETRERVWEVIRQSGYQPNVVARSLVTTRTHIIGMIIPYAVTALFTDPFFPLLLRGATEACNQHHYQLLLSLLNDPAGRGEMYRQVLQNGYMDGMIVASTPVDDPLIPNLIADRLPFVSVGRHPDERVHYVDVDNVGGAQMAVEHLIRLGHRRIATITGRLDMVAGQDRLAGYRQALQAHGLPIRKELIAEGDFTEIGGTTAAQRLLSTDATAIFVASDIMAIAALKTLRQAGRLVPNDVALVSFDDVPVAAAIDPPLTTVRQPIARMGSMAVEVLLSLLDRPEEGRLAHRIILPTELVIRESCGAVAARAK